MIFKTFLKYPRFTENDVIIPGKLDILLGLRLKSFVLVQGTICANFHAFSTIGMIQCIFCTILLHYVNNTGFGEIKNNFSEKKTKWEEIFFELDFYDVKRCFLIFTRQLQKCSIKYPYTFFHNTLKIGIDKPFQFLKFSAWEGLVSSTLQVFFYTRKLGFDLGDTHNSTTATDIKSYEKFSSVKIAAICGGSAQKSSSLIVGHRMRGFVLNILCVVVFASP